MKSYSVSNIFGFILTFLTVSFAIAQSKTGGELSAVRSKYLIKDSTSMQVFVEMEFAEVSNAQLSQNFTDNFRISWVVYPDYGVRERLASGAFVGSTSTLFQNSDKLYAVIDVNKVKGSKAVFFAEITNGASGKKDLIDVVFDLRSPRLENHLAIFQENIPVPNFDNYVQYNQKLLVRAIDNIQRKLYLVRYKHEFDAAAPPTSITNRSVPRSLKIDSVSSISNNVSFQISGEGLYFITADTAKMSSGISFLGVDDRYPRLTRPEKLIKALSYISSNQEINEFLNAAVPKTAIDNFFLKVTSGNPIVAKQAIRSYFRRVTAANKLFTSYKEGWKTDRGMVYIILGPPSSVQHSREREVWQYEQNQNFSEITFTFNKKNNQFTENHYELIRYPEYQAYWYPIVDAWRIGSITSN